MGGFATSTDQIALVERLDSEIKVLVSLSARDFN